MGNDTIIFIVDSLSRAEFSSALSDSQTITSKASGFQEVLDVLHKVAMILIGIFNAWFALAIYKLKDKKEDTTKESDRKVALLKTLILDYNLKYVYESFDSLNEHLQTLKDQHANKKEIEKNIQADFKNLSEKFINFLAAVDNKLYLEILSISDRCRDTLVENISDEGVNLYVDAQYRDKIEKPYDNAKKELLKALFNYKGA